MLCSTFPHLTEHPESGATRIADIGELRRETKVNEAKIVVKAAGRIAAVGLLVASFRLSKRGESQTHISV